MLLRLSRLLALAGALLAGGALATADDLSRRMDDPRAIGRAGATNVSSDSGAALVHNPGAMIRRTQGRLVLGTGLADRDARFASASHPSSPLIDNRAGPQTAPLLAFHQGDSEGRWVLGVALMNSQWRSNLPAPAFGQPAQDVERLFPHRYGGTDLQIESSRLAFGAAMRVGDSLGLGLSASLSQVSLRESRRVWAGFAGRDRLLGAEQDLELVLRGEDLYSPGASIGALLAPPDMPFEFALGLEYRRGPRFRQGRAELNATSSAAFPAPQATGAKSSLTIADSAVLRAGARYLGSRSFVELAADYQLQQGRDRPEWRIDGMSVSDQSTAQAEILSIPALQSSRSHMALRASVDYEVVQGFLWLTGGYAWTAPATPRGWRTPVDAQLGGHTLAGGLEASYQNYLLSVGYARALRRERSLAASGSDTPAFNPFDAGSGPANAGSYSSSGDELGFAVEVAWD